MPRKTNLTQNQWLYLGEARWEIAESGFDTSVRPYTLLGSASPVSDFELGDQHPNYSNMYVVGMNFSYPKTSVTQLEVNYKGIRASKGVKTSARAYSEKTTTADDAIAGFSSGGVPVQVNDSKVSVTESYISTTEPSMNVVGTAQAPLTSVSTPPNRFPLVTDPTFVFPSGWVLENRSFEQLLDKPIYFVTNEYIFYHPFKP